MRKNLPSSAGICHRRSSDGTFTRQVMQTRTTWSYEAINWLDWMQTDDRFKDTTIQHALNNGEKIIHVGDRRYSVDGYAVVDGRPHFLEYDGCAYHHCECPDSKSSFFTKSDDSKRNQDLSSIGILITMRSCQWNAMKSGLVYKSSISTFYNTKKITEANIMNAVASGEFYGLIQVDVTSPPDVIEHFLKLNHPPVFKHICVEEDMINATFRQKLVEKKVKFPLEKQLTLCFNAEGYLMSTDLAQFYLEKGMKLSNLQLAIEYPRTQPLANFVNLVTAKRKEATRLKDNNLQQTYKLVMNSSYGRLGLNLENRRSFTYKNIPTEPPVDCNTKKINRITPVNGEFEAEYLEVEKPKLKYVDNIPGKLQTLSMHNLN